MTITFSQIDALDPCWTVEELASRLPADDTPVELTLDGLLSLPVSDARWLVTNLMTRQQLITWANGCAERAKGYAAADADAVYSAAAAADAVAVADAAWAAAADAAAEHRKAMEHALELLNS